MVRLLTVIAAGTALISSVNSLLNNTVHWPVYVKYTTVTGYFLQDDPSTNATTFNYVSYSLLAAHPKPTENV